MEPFLIDAERTFDAGAENARDAAERPLDDISKRALAFEVAEPRGARRRKAIARKVERELVGGAAERRRTPL